MQEHPFLSSFGYRLAGILSVAVGTALYAFLLAYYTCTPVIVALVESIAAMGVLGAAGILLWYITGVLRAIQAHAVICLLVTLISVAAAFVAEAFFPPVNIPHFLAGLPIRLLIAVTWWIILAQAYHIRHQAVSRVSEAEPLAVPQAPPSVQPEHITVKDGSRIHILNIEEIHYIEASGDYVTLFTATGQYLKEQTMKHFTQQLAPCGFVRIHRSYLANTRQIARIELFGKETYQVKLKNGSVLRASTTGYKLLKTCLQL